MFSTVTFCCLADRLEELPRTSWFLAGFYYSSLLKMLPAFLFQEKFHWKEKENNFKLLFYFPSSHISPLLFDFLCVRLFTYFADIPIDIYQYTALLFWWDHTQIDYQHVQIENKKKKYDFIKSFIFLYKMVQSTQFYLEIFFSSLNVRWPNNYFKRLVVNLQVKIETFVKNWLFLCCSLKSINCL